MQPAIELDVVHARNAKDDINTVFASEQINYRFTDAKLVGSHELVVL
jgi:hypothetical protein